MLTLWNEYRTKVAEQTLNTESEGIHVMIETSIVLLLATVGIASGLALLDCWLRGRFVFEGLQEERALLEAGFIPMQEGAEPRLRERVGFQSLAMPARIPAHRSVDRVRLSPPLKERRISPARGAA